MPGVISFHADTHGRFNTESVLTQLENVDLASIRCHAHDEQDHNIYNIHVQLKN